MKNTTQILNKIIISVIIMTILSFSKEAKAQNINQILGIVGTIAKGNQNQGYRPQQNYGQNYRQNYERPQVYQRNCRDEDGEIITCRTHNNRAGYDENHTSDNEYSSSNYNQTRNLDYDRRQNIIAQQKLEIAQMEQRKLLLEQKLRNRRQAKINKNTDDTYNQNNKCVIEYRNRDDSYGNIIRKKVTVCE